MYIVYLSLYIYIYILCIYIYIYIHIVLRCFLLRVGRTLCYRRAVGILRIHTGPRVVVVAVVVVVVVVVVPGVGGPAEASVICDLQVF